MFAEDPGKRRPAAAFGPYPASRSWSRSRRAWCLCLTVFVAGLLVPGASSRPCIARETRPCVEVVADPGGAPTPGELEEIGTALRAAVQCAGDHRVRVTVSSRDGNRGLRAVIEGPEDIASTSSLRGLEHGEGVRGALGTWGGDLTADMRLLEARRIRRQRNATDWIRVSALAGATGAVGGRLAFITLKWDHAYLTVLQGGGIVAPFASHGTLMTSTYGFVGPEVGAAFRWGRHWLGVGGQVGFGVQAGGLMEGEPNDNGHGIFILGGMVAPTIRYRHYWGLFGLEVSLECPITFGSGGGGIGTPWPIVGLGVGF